MSKAKTKAAAPASESRVSLTEKQVKELIERLDTARSAVLVCATALDTGDDRSDLELHSATLLKRAFDEMDFVYTDLIMVRGNMRSVEP
jgi:hypothetical protein